MYKFKIDFCIVSFEYQTTEKLKVFTVKTHQLFAMLDDSPRSVLLQCNGVSESILSIKCCNSLRAELMS